jgi:CBS-domain-containing membrane protein
VLSSRLKVTPKSFKNKTLIYTKIQRKNMHESVTIQDVYEALKRVEEKMVTREDIEALIDSVEILSNPKTMEALRKSEEDIKAGRVKEVTSVDDLLAEL